MPLHPDIKRVLDAIPPSLGLDVDHLPLDQAVHQLRNRPVKFIPVENPVAVEDRMIELADRTMRVRLYTPPGAGPFGVVVNFHGGGWVIGSIELDDYLCQLLAQTGVIVVSAEYRLAPESTFPGPFDDCYAIASWAAEHVADLNGLPRGIALMGSSAGGNLAAAVALKARDSGGPRIVGQVLIYPVCDGRLELPSYTSNATGYYLTRGSMVWFWDRYAPNLADRENPYASPLRASSFANLPPSLVIAAEFDPLRDEAEAYANALRAAGVPVQFVCYEGVVHGFFRLVPGAPWVTSIISRSADLLRQAFST